MKKKVGANFQILGFAMIVFALLQFGKIVNISDSTVFFLWLVIVFCIAVFLFSLRKPKYTDYEIFWRATKMQCNDVYPEVIEDKLENDNTSFHKTVRKLKVKMPAGMSKSDFEKTKEAFEQHLKSRVAFDFEDSLNITIEKMDGKKYPYNSETAK